MIDVKECKDGLKSSTTTPSRSRTSFEDPTVTQSSALEIPTQKYPLNDEVRILPPIRNLKSQYSHTE